MIKWFMGLNRHLRIAIILAPFLGIFGFGLTDTWINKDKPSPATQRVLVRELQLVGQCILSGGECKLSKDEMGVDLRSAVSTATNLLRLEISSTGHVRGLKMSLVQAGREDKLVPQRTMKTDRWYVEFPRSLVTQSSLTIRIALAQTRRVYLAEFPAQL